MALLVIQNKVHLEATSHQWPVGLHTEKSPTVNMSLIYILCIWHIGVGLKMEYFSLKWNIFLLWLLYFSAPEHQKTTSNL